MPRVLIAALACSILTLILFNGKNKYRRVRTRLAEIATLTYLLVRSENTPWYGAHDNVSMVLMVGLATAVVWDEIHDSCAAPAARVRKLYYVIAFVFSALTLAWYAYEVVQVLDRNPLYTPSDTTNTAHCKLTKVDDAILFTSHHPYDTCPSNLWKYARVNVILMTQLYMLYALTTTLKYESYETQIPYLLARVFFECVLLTLAALWQFDIIQDCYVIKTPTLVLLLAAGVLRVLREYNTHANPGLKGANRTAVMPNCALLPTDLPWGMRQRPPSHVKIKL